MCIPNEDGYSDKWYVCVGADKVSEEGVCEEKVGPRSRCRMNGQSPARRAKCDDPWCRLGEPNETGEGTYCKDNSVVRCSSSPEQVLTVVKPCVGERRQIMKGCYEVTSHECTGGHNEARCEQLSKPVREETESEGCLEDRRRRSDYDDYDDNRRRRRSGIEITHKPGVVHNEAIHIPGSVEIIDGGGEVTHEIHEGEGEE